MHPNICSVKIQSDELFSKIRTNKYKKYYQNAYLVQCDRKSEATIAIIPKKLAKITGYYKRVQIIITKNGFLHFEKHFTNKKTGIIDTTKLFQFIDTLNAPDEIYQNYDNRLHYFKSMSPYCVYQVVIDKATNFPFRSIIVTQFDNNIKIAKDKKYLQRQ